MTEDNLLRATDAAASEDVRESPEAVRESPEYVKLSLASAMALGLCRGRFYRNAANPCINLLLTYSRGCLANCAYCGLASERSGQYADKSFIKVEWATFDLEEVVERVKETGSRVRRLCLSMITNPRARQDTLDIIQRLAPKVTPPLSVLIAPTLVKRDDLASYKAAGADRVGIAVDAATEALFDRHRGSDVRGPHDWGRYWETVTEAIDIFGAANVGVHLIVGLGESEKEMAATLQRVHDLGSRTHLFSFFAETNSTLGHLPQPPMGQYRRIQLALHLIDRDIARADGFQFDAQDRIRGFGISEDRLREVVVSGESFMTSGCPGRDGRVACTRPYANCLPGPDIRNYPFRPDRADLERIVSQVWQYE